MLFDPEKAAETGCARQRSLSNKPVSSSVDRFNKARRIGVVPQGFADFGDAMLQRLFSDMAIAPDGVHQLVFGNKPVELRNQAPQESKRLRP